MKLSINKWYASLFSFGIIIVLPIIVLALWSVSGKWIFPALIPQKVDFNTIKHMINDPIFFPSILNSFVIASSTTVTSLAIALPAARYFAFQKDLSSRVVEGVIYLPLILPAIAIVTSSQILFLKFHLTGTFLGIVLIHTYVCLPYAMQILLESYRQLGEGYYLTAQSLGAKPWYIFHHITWPLLKNGVGTAATLVFIVSFSQYLPTFFIGGGQIITLPMLLLPYANNGRLVLASSYSIVFLICTLIGVFILKLIMRRK